MAKQGRHKSMDKDLKRSVRWLENLAGIEKVILSFSEACRHKYPPGTLRFKQDVDGGIKINGYSGKGVTDIFVKIHPINQRDTIKSILKKRLS